MIDGILADAVFETTTTTGTGTISLAGAQTGYEAFSDNFSDGKLVTYVIEQIQEDANGNTTGISREVGIGTLTHGSPDTISRDYVLSSSNSDALVNFGSGTKDVYCVPASASVGWNLASLSSITADPTIDPTNNDITYLADASGGAFSITLPAVADVFVGFRVRVIKTDATADVTISGDTSETINGVIDYVLSEQYQSATLVTDRSVWYVQSGGLSELKDDASPQLGGALDTNGNTIDRVHTPNAAGGDQGPDTGNFSAVYDDGVQIHPYVRGTAVASTSGTAIDFTSIPSWVTRISIPLEEVSTNGTSNIKVQIGDSGGVETSGYLSGTSFLGGSVSTTSYSDGLVLIDSFSGSGDYISGLALLELIDSSTNLWAMNAIVNRTAGSPQYVSSSRKALTGTLDRVRITANGTNTFDRGTINVNYG